MLGWSCEGHGARCRGCRRWSCARLSGGTRTRVFRADDRAPLWGWAGHGVVGAGVGVAGAAEEATGPRVEAGSVQAVIDGVLLRDLTALAKEPHTVTRIRDRLIAEHGQRGVSYQVIRPYVADRRRELMTEHGRPRSADAVFVTQSYRPRFEAEVDVGEVEVKVRGE